MNTIASTQDLSPAPRGASVAVPIAIPLARLVASAANVRKTGAKGGIAELAASIEAHGLRQNLNVRPAEEGERFEVVAGGRRLRALRLLALFRKGELTLEQMMAFTVTDDHAEQERVWKELPEWRLDADDIRSALTREAARFDTPLARFVGLDAYVTAGGAVMRDLFEEGSEGYASDRLLLLSLAGDRLNALAEAVKAEGWKWVKAEVERDYSVHYRRVYAVAS